MYLFYTSTQIYKTTNGSHLSTQRVKTLIHTIKLCVEISNTDLKICQNIHHLTKGMSFRSLSWFIFFTLISSHFDENAIVVRILVAHLENGCQVIYYCSLNFLECGFELLYEGFESPSLNLLEKLQN